PPRLRRLRIPPLPRLRHSRAWLCPRALHLLRRRDAGRLLLQEPRILSFLHYPPHAGDFDPPRGPRAPARTHPPVGPLAAALGAFPPRPRRSAHHPHARPGAARD